MKVRQIALIPFIVIAANSLPSCNQKEENLRILRQFEKEVMASVAKRKANGDSVDINIVFDTLCVEKLDVKNCQLAFAQYHTADNKLDLSILGIENFDNPSTPTFLLVDNRMKEYRIDSVKIVRDSLYVFCKSIFAAEVENVKIGFDLSFNGKSFPWSVN